MNNEEAIKYGIEWLEDEYLDAGERAFIELALEALKQIPVITTTGEGGVIYYPQVEGVTPTVIDVGKQEPCEMTAEEYRQRMIQAFHNADTDELIAVCVLPTEKEFEHLEWLLKNHYKKEPCGDAIDRAEAIKIASGYCHPANVAKELAKLPPVNPQLCEDAISRQAVIDSLHSKFADGFDSDRWWNSMSVLYAINKVPPVNPTKTGHWIPVSERMPEKNMTCLVAVGKFNLTQMAMYSDLMGTINRRIFYQGDVGYGSFEDITEYVKAWMPLPAPYEPQESEGEG